MKLIVFDCDGTLVDSQHFITACMEAAFAAEGAGVPDPAAVRAMIGLPLDVIVARLRPALAPPHHAALVAAYKDQFHRLRARADFHEPLFEGAREALDALEAAGFLLGVATGKGRRGLQAVLDHHGLAQRFVTLQTGDVPPGKPHPAMLQRAMAEAGASPAATAMIGDTSFDMEMARAAGAWAIGVAWGYHPVDSLRASGAASVIQRFAELPGLLARREAP